MKWIAAAQPLLLATVLAWSGGVKLLGRTVRSRVAGTALHRLLGARRAVPAYLALGVVELGLAFALLATPGRPAPAAAAVLSAGFLGYLTYAAKAAPDSSCGCLGPGHSGVSWRSFGRAGLMLAASLTAAVAGVSWWWELRWGGVALFAAELVAVVVLSPELDRHWLVPARRLRARLTHPLASEHPDTVPLHATVTQLERSDAFRRVAPLLTSDVLEHWDEAEWRIVCYGARYQDRAATAVFAVPLHEEPAAVRVTLVDEAAGEPVLV